MVDENTAVLDSVGTITLSQFMHEPERHDLDTLELIRAELVYPVDPMEAGTTNSHNFPSFLDGLNLVEFAGRQRKFRNGQSPASIWTNFFTNTAYASWTIWASQCGRRGIGRRWSFRPLTNSWLLSY